MKRLSDIVKPFELQRVFHRMTTTSSENPVAISEVYEQLDDLAPYKDAVEPILMQYIKQFGPHGAAMYLAGFMVSLHVIDRALQAQVEEEPKPKGERVQ